MEHTVIEEVINSNTLSRDKLNEVEYTARVLNEVFLYFYF
jgi:hypothetical protein